MTANIVLAVATAALLVNLGLFVSSVILLFRLRRLVVLYHVLCSTAWNLRGWPMIRVVRTVYQAQDERND